MGIIFLLLPTLRMRSARRASVRSAGCEALCAEQSADTPHPQRCRGAKRPRQRGINPLGGLNDWLETIISQLFLPRPIIFFSLQRYHKTLITLSG
jgi:hypothetical protein